MRNKENWMDNPASGAESSQTVWRENFLNEVSRYSLAIAAIVGVVAISAALKESRFIVGLADISFIGLLLGVALGQRMGFRTRSNLFLLAGFLFSISMMMELGILSQKYFLGVTFMAAILLTRRRAHMFNVICIGCIFLYHLCLSDNLLIHPSIYTSNLQGALLIPLNYAAISTMLTFAITQMTFAIDFMYRVEQERAALIEAEHVELQKANHALSMEVVARLEAENALKRSQDQLERFLETVQLGLFEYDCEEKSFSMINSYFGRLFYGLSKGRKVIESELLGHVMAEDHPAALAARRQALSGKAAAVELRMVAQGGAPRWFMLSGNPVMASNGLVAKIVGSMQDITEVKELEIKNTFFRQRLEEKKVLENLGHLAAGIAHDFNNLLAIILSTAEVAHMALVQGARDELDRFLQDIVAMTDRGRTLTRQLLGFSKQTHVSYSLIDLGEVLGGTERLLRHIVKNPVQLRVQAGPPGLYIKFDPHMLEQMLTNLVLNSQHAIAGPGEISLSYEAANTPLDSNLAKSELPLGAIGWVVISVSDTGCGMTEETQASALTPFFSTKGTGSGTGLGLSNVEAGLQSCGGMLAIQSELGKGTRVSLYFPRHEPEKVQPTIEPLTGIRNSRRIVLVDDDASLLAMTKQTLTLLGHEVRAFENPADCLRELASNAEDLGLLITDIQMPELNGISLATEVRCLRPDLPLIFISGYSDVRVDSFLEKKQPRTVLIEKPFRATVLGKAVAELLSSS